MQWLHITENVQCPCCYSDHIKHTDTIKRASSLVDTLLHSLNFQCDKCHATVKLGDCSQHKRSPTSDPSPSSDQVEAILRRGQDTPLSPLEHSLQRNLAERSISQNPHSLLQMKTGGQVRQHAHAVDSQSVSVYIHTYIHYICIV